MMLKELTLRVCDGRVARDSGAAESATVADDGIAVMPVSECSLSDITLRARANWGAATPEPNPAPKPRGWSVSDGGLVRDARDGEMVTAADAGRVNADWDWKDTDTGPR